MDASKVLALISALLPLVEQGVAIFIHNPNSVQQFAATVGEVNSVAAVAAQVAAAPAK